MHSSTEVHSLDDDMDEPMDATKVLNMVKNDMSIQMGDVYVDQRQQHLKACQVQAVEVGL